MRVWVEVFDTSDVKLGVAYDILEAQVTKALDAAGTIDLSFPAQSETTVSLLSQERRVRIWIEQDEKTRLLGAGTLREISIDETEGSAKITVSGPDELDQLTRKSLLRNRSYSAETIASVTSDLVGLVSGWTVVPENGLGSITASFDGSSVLKALIRIADETGLHIRLGDTPKTVEVGVFGTDNGIIAMKPGGMFPELYDADNVLLISKMKRTTNSKDVVNWIIPLGKDTGQGDFLTMANSTGANILTTTGNNADTLFYLQDSDSIETYGQIEKIVAFDEITDADALYEAAQAWLDRNSMPLVKYSIEAKKCRTQLQPGDLISVKYKGIVETETGYFSYLDVNETFWIIKTTENISDEGINLNLDVATIPRYEIDTTEIIVGALEKINVRSVNANENIGYIKIVEQQNAGVDGGTFTQGAWQTRGLNTIITNEHNHASLSSNQFTLDAGTYKYRGWAVGSACSTHQCKLYNVTTASDVDLGDTAFSGSTSATSIASTVVGQFTIDASSVFELRHQCLSTKATTGLGVAGGFSTEIYAMIELDKIA